MPALSHTGSDGSSPFDRMRKAGYSGSAMGENIARGYSTSESVVEAWMNSPGHRSNILNRAFQHLGVGMAGTGGGRNWVQCLGSGAAVAEVLVTPLARAAAVPADWQPEHGDVGEPWMEVVA